MKNLLIKLQNKRKEEKGFTLVELLVVIAILAILASVSVVGYMGFTQKAKDSNAATELAQAKTVVTTSLLDGKDTSYSYNAKTGKLYALNLEANTLAGTTFKTHFADLEALKGEFTIVLGTASTIDTTGTNNDYVFTSITYTVNDGTATWTF